ncbi:hypothetical protein HPP92_010786 [Vanilla planifolia]|uniref:GTD-binding domain-containing protein n=1 Tax=Vanilla planifolia TaxID=51239 RepID=A0A835R229_VANPL|nr:hypothetical protein HPP92_011038 [Vanilla planifolia]KAG0482702.1 hypothetical protein HPP92_010786 [Vanilla planifolia]
MDEEADGGGERLPCNCSCPCCGFRSCSGLLPPSELRRNLKRKLDEMEEDARRGRPTDVARVEIEIEAAALREALGSNQQSIQDLHSELEEERAAAATAASEAMSMILRLQREKAETQMDARQFKRFAEEMMCHDQQEIALLEDLLFKRDQAVQSLSCELQAYRHRLLSYGIDPNPSEPGSPIVSAPTTPTCNGGGDAYPPLRCETVGFPAVASMATADPDLKYAAGDTPRGRLQRMPSIVMEKSVIGQGQSPRWPQRSLRRLSIDSCGSPLLRPEVTNSEFSSGIERATDAVGAGGRDDMSDRVYTVDSVHVVDGMYDEYTGTPREFMNKRDVSGGVADEGDLRRLYMRLQALEADRESMRQAIMTMGTDKAQVALLKEVAQQLCNEAVPKRKMVTKPSIILRSFSVISKRLISFFSWRKRTKRIKYPFGLSNQSAGLLVILEKNPRMKQRRCLTRAPR